MCFTLIGIAYQSVSYALETSPIPFIGDQLDYKIDLPGDQSLYHLLKKEIIRQRQTNQQLMQFSRRDKHARYESQLLTARLHAEGYYAAQVTSSLRDDHILYRVEPGPVYRVHDISINLPNNIELPQKLIKILPGDSLRAEVVLADKKALTDYISSNYCLYRINTEYRVLVDHQTQSAQITFNVADSPTVRFGTISFTGLRSVDESYLRARLPISEGECFRRTHIDSARLTLIQTNLLVSVSANVSLPDNDLVPIEFSVVERYHRTISAGVGFQSDVGFGISLGWEHRNLGGNAQKLTIDSHIAENSQALTSSLTLPHFHRNNQSLTLFADLEREDTDAFESKTGVLGAELSRQLKSNLKGLLGTELAFSRVEEGGLEDNFALLSLPLSLEYDRRNDSLDPRTGWVAAGRVHPFWDIYNTETKFLKSTLAASTYISLDDFYWKPTIAMRGALGSISGADRDQVPANVRFYAGGGGSVRGYAFQSLGPLTDSEPDGGLSFTELSIEMRLRWGQHWGGVIFLDGGFAYEDRLPDIGKDLLWGAGLGIRYYTSFAPIRFDIGIPLDKRDGIDDDFQIYISIGQAF